MDERARRAGIALRLVTAAAAGDTAADSLLLDAFDSVDEAAEAHAYLNGYLLHLLAAARQESPSDTCALVAELLARDGPTLGRRWEWPGWGA